MLKSNALAYPETDLQNALQSTTAFLWAGLPDSRHAVDLLHKGF